MRWCHNSAGDYLPRCSPALMTAWFYNLRNWPLIIAYAWLDFVIQSFRGIPDDLRYRFAIALAALPG